MYGLGLKTDLMLLAPFAEITENDGVIRVVSPDFPTYYFGNFLIVDHPPNNPRDAIDLFQTAFSRRPGIQHVTLCWDGQDVAAETAKQYADAGLVHCVDTVLTTQMPIAQDAVPTGITFRTLQSDTDWEQVIALENDTYKDEYENYLAFVKESVENHKVRIGQGMGHWFGAFDRDILVGSMGLFCVDTVARYQSVVTHADYRGRGIASHLLRFAATQMAEMHDITDYVIVAENASNAQRLYAKCGFVPVQQTYSLCCYPEAAS